MRTSMLPSVSLMVVLGPGRMPPRRHPRLDEAQVVAGGVVMRVELERADDPDARAAEVAAQHVGQRLVIEYLRRFPGERDCGGIGAVGERVAPDVVVAGGERDP